MKKSKKITIIITSTLLLLCFAIALFWNTLTFQPLLQSKVLKENQTIENAASTAIEEYLKQYEKWYLPFDKQISEHFIRKVEVLDQSGYVQVDYTIQFRFANTIPDYFSSDDFYLSKSEDKRYNGQLVICLKNNKTYYEVIDVLTPVQYQIQFDKTSQTPQVRPYLMDDKMETYFFDNHELYVTYNHAQTSTKVDVDYDALVSAYGLTYDEYLSDGSYIVSPSFTGFFTYTNNDELILNYSLDSAKTWKQTSVAQNQVPNTNLFLNKVDNTYYVCFANDRSLGHDYYAIKQSSDLINWQFVDTSKVGFDQFSALFYVATNHAYFAPQVSYQQESKPCTLYYTNTNFATQSEIILPEVTSVSQILGYNPFINVEYIYQENGKIYVEVGQGANGDYSKDGYLVKALYESSDGINFTFVKEFNNAKQMAG